MRVYELAKELGISSKEVLGKLKAMDVEVKSHMSQVNETALELLREADAPSAPPPAKEGRQEKTESSSTQTDAKAPSEPETSDKQPGEEPEPASAKDSRQAPPSGPSPSLSVEDKVIRARGSIVVKDFAESMGIRPNLLIAELMSMNIFAAINQRLDIKAASAIAGKHGFTIEQEKKPTESQAQKRLILEEPEEEDRPEDLELRPPVVAFLGHVDHGKTSLLDKIRSASVVDGEFGSITQHIGAYTVDVEGKSITFVDTPGHAAFTAMRERGANLTDISIIIIAADDGIMPQTREAIKHARKAGVQIMVAINKTDLPTANVEKVKQQLQAEDLAPEDWGGDVVCCPVSAQTGDGINHLLEMILLQADMLELKANRRRRAGGYVIESQLEPGMGPTANLLVKTGTLKLGDSIRCGPFWGRVKALINDHDVKVKSAMPSTPVKCMGLSGVPEAGAEFRVCSNDKIARALAREEAENLRTEKQESGGPPKTQSLEDLFEQIEDEKVREIKLLLRADTKGSLEAIADALETIKSEKVLREIIFSDTGNITTNDVLIASASEAVILGFHVEKEPRVDAEAKHENVDIRLCRIIYELVDEVRAMMLAKVKPEFVEQDRGEAQIKQIFNIGKTGNIAGCVVTRGVIRNGGKARVRRDSEQLVEATITTLKHFQNEVPEVKEGQECGIRLDNYSAFEEGDILECYEIEELERAL